MRVCVPKAPRSFPGAPGRLSATGDQARSHSRLGTSLVLAGARGHGGELIERGPP
jgi:hypothetical protein